MSAVREPKSFQPMPANYPYFSLREHQDYLDRRTFVYYYDLTQDDRLVIINWLKENLENIFLPGKIKRNGIQRLLLGEYKYPSVLLLIRYAINNLYPEFHF